MPPRKRPHSSYGQGQTPKRQKVDEGDANRGDDSARKAMYERLRAQREEQRRGNMSRREEDKRVDPASRSGSATLSSNVVGINVPLHPLLAKKQQQQQGKGQTPYTPGPPGTPLGATPRAGSNPYVDNDIENGKHYRKGFRFNEPGKYIEQGDALRARVEQERQQKEAEEAYRQRLINEGMDLVADERQFKPDAPPQVEWWDAQVDQVELNDLVFHPIPVRPPGEQFNPKEYKVHMTKQELKRRRKLTRQESHKEKQDRIRLGLDPPPPPKVRLKNLMNVYTNEAIKDPTKLEQKVRKEVESRKEKHEAENEARKKTPDQVWEKKQEKIEREKSKHGLFTAVFKITHLSDRKHKYVVNVEAKKNNFTGMVVFNPQFCLVVVEGGKQDVQKYIKRLQRVHWTEASAPIGDEQESQPSPDLAGNKCELVWHGQLDQNRNKFSRWTLKDAETEQDAKDLLGRHGAETYWLQARALS